MVTTIQNDLEANHRNNVSELTKTRPIKRPSRAPHAPVTPGAGSTANQIPSGKVLDFNRNIRSAGRVGSALWSKPTALVASQWLTVARDIVEGDSRAKLVSGVITKGINLLGVA